MHYLLQRSITNAIVKNAIKKYGLKHLQGKFQLEVVSAQLVLAHRQLGLLKCLFCRI